MWMLAALVALGACTSGEPATVVSGDGTTDGDITAETLDPTDDPDLPASFERLRGTSWQIIEIDGEATLPDGIGLALYMTDEGLKGSVTDRCGGTGEFFLDPDFTVVRTQILAALCSPAWSDVFRTNASVRFELGDRLTISNDEHVMVARHFESVSQTGPVVLSALPDCGDTERMESEAGLRDGTPSPYRDVNDLRMAIEAGEFGPMRTATIDLELVDTRGVGGEQAVMAWYADPDGRIALVITMLEDDGWFLGSWGSCDLSPG